MQSRAPCVRARGPARRGRAVTKGSASAPWCDETGTGRSGGPRSRRPHGAPTRRRPPAPPRAPRSRRCRPGAAAGLSGATSAPTRPLRPGPGARRWARRARRRPAGIAEHAPASGEASGGRDACRHRACRPVTAGIGWPRGGAGREGQEARRSARHEQRRLGVAHDQHVRGRGQAEEPDGPTGHHERRRSRGAPGRRAAPWPR